MQKLSRYCHIYHKEGQLRVYHALRMAHLPYPGDEGTLREQGFLVECDAEDDRLLEQCRAEIQEPYISTAYFFLTQNCNLACRYCFERQSETENSQEGVMSEEVLHGGLDFFQRLIRLDPDRYEERKSIIFYGGEPFHNKRLLFHAIEEVGRRMEAGLLPRSTKMLVVTNGTLMQDDDIRFLKEHDITVTFSLDGDERASANRVYPDGKTLAWHRATETFRKCASAGLNLNIACTLTPQTIERQRETLDYFISIGARNIGFNVILDNDIIQLGPGYADDAARFVASSYRTLSDHHITENRTRRRLDVFRHKHPCLFDCNAAGGRQIAIAPNGDVGICHEHIMDKQHFITTIHDTSFDPRRSEEYRLWHHRSPLYMEACRDCIALGVCGGGCVINSERKKGSLFEPDPRFCKQTLAILNDILL